MAKNVARDLKMYLRWLVLLKIFEHFSLKKKKEQKNDAGDTFEIFNDNKNVRTFLEIDEK